MAPMALPDWPPTRRFWLRPARCWDIAFAGALQSPEKVGEYLTMRLGHLDYECFGLILVDGRHRVIDCAELFRGSIDGASVYPREVVKLALDKGAAAAVACHNHPSGVKDQSHADELITKRLAQSLAAAHQSRFRRLDGQAPRGHQFLAHRGMAQAPAYRRIGTLDH
jgi:hypothetical protein